MERANRLELHSVNPLQSGIDVSYRIAAHARAPGGALDEKSLHVAVSSAAIHCPEGSRSAVVFSALSREHREQLQTVAAAWPKLSEPLRSAVLAIVNCPNQA